MCRRRYITHRRHARFIHFKTKKGITSLLIEFPRKTDVSLLTRRTTTARVRVPARRRVRRIPRSRVVIRRSIIVRVVIRTVRVRVCVAESNHIRPSVSLSNRMQTNRMQISFRHCHSIAINRTHSDTTNRSSSWFHPGWSSCFLGCSFRVPCCVLSFVRCACVRGSIDRSSAWLCRTRRF